MGQLPTRIILSHQLATCLIPFLLTCEKLDQLFDVILWLSYQLLFPLSHFISYLSIRDIFFVLVHDELLNCGRLGIHRVEAIHVCEDFGI